MLHQQLSWVLCDDRVGWDDGGKIGAQEGADTGTLTAESHCCTAETRHCKAIMLQLKNSNIKKYIGISLPKE